MHCMVTQQSYTDDVAACSAKQLYKGSVQGALEAASIQHELHVTRGPHHATEILAGLDLQGVDAVLFMGGDGTLHEGLQVLLDYPDPYRWQPSSCCRASALTCQ